MFRDWLIMLANLADNNYSAKEFACVECGEKSIEFIVEMR